MISLDLTCRNRVWIHAFLRLSLALTLKTVNIGLKIISIALSKDKSETRLVISKTPYSDLFENKD